MTLLSAKNLSLTVLNRGQESSLLKDVSFSIQEGEFLALVGESGSGKTLTTLALAQLLDKKIYKSTGEILYKDEDLSVNLNGLKEAELNPLRAKKIAMIFQDPLSALNPVMKLGDQVLEVILAHEKITRSQAYKRVMMLFSHVGLSEVQGLYNRYAHELSGGQRQRVMMAMALALSPKLLIADEPTTSLDVTVQFQILELLKKLKEAYRLTVLFVTHDLSIVAQYADRVLVMQAGQIVESGRVLDIFSKPEHPYTQKLLSARLEKRIFNADASLNPKIILSIKKAQVDYTQSHIMQTALKAMDLDLYEGEILGVAGESGSGKSTLAKALLKLLPLTQGEIFLDNQNLTKATYRQMRLYRPHLQMIFQDPVASLTPHKTIQSLLLEPLRLYQKGSKATLEAQVNEILTEVGLGLNLLNRKPRELSGGQCQRVAIARALLMRPKILIADEATTALDVSVQKQILELLLRLKDRYKMTLVLISHHLTLLKSVSDRILVMHEGQLVEILPRTQFETPAHPYTRFLASHTLSMDPSQRS